MSLILAICCEKVTKQLGKPKWLDKPNELGPWFVYGVFERGYSVVKVFIPDCIEKAGLAVCVIGNQGWYELEEFMSLYKTTKWQKATMQSEGK